MLPQILPDLEVRVKTYIEPRILDLFFGRSSAPKGETYTVIAYTPS